MFNDQICIGISVFFLQKHYYVFYLKILRAHRRQFTESGQEIEPNFSETKKVSTGYLNSSYSKLLCQSWTLYHTEKI